MSSEKVLIPQLSDHAPKCPKIPHNYQKNADLRLFRSSPYANFFTNGFLVPVYPLYVKISYETFWKHHKTIFWTQKTWKLLRYCYVRKLLFTYSERGHYFTSDGFFKIWNISTRENFPIFGLYFVPTLLITGMACFRPVVSHGCLCYNAKVVE